MAAVGVFPSAQGQIFAEQQNAIILYDSDRKRQTTILQTNVRTSRPGKGVFFMPLPGKPKTSLADPKILERTLALAQAKSLTYGKLRDFLALTIGPEWGPVDYRRGITVTAHKPFLDHDVTVVKLESLSVFRSWMFRFLAEKNLGTEFDFGKLEAVASQYFEDGFRYFLFDVVKLGAETRTTKPLVIDFPSHQIYLPLRVNTLYSGATDLNVFLFTNVSFPSERFAQLGFAASESVGLSEPDLDHVGREVRSRLGARGLRFQCLLLEDPRKLLAHLKSRQAEFYFRRKPSNIDLYKRLRNEALARWRRDVLLRVKWGKRHDPDYTVTSSFDLMVSLCGYDDPNDDF